jgi:hypothetical protein
MTKTPLPRSAACAAFEHLLPLAGHNLLDESDAAQLRAHVATCAACQAKLAIYDRVELAWRRAFEPRQDATPIVSQDALLDILTDTPARASTISASPAGPARRPVLAEQRGRPRRLIGALSALAAVLLIAAIVGAALLARAHPTRVAGGPAPSQPPYQNISVSGFNDIAMVSPTEGWAVGGTYTAVYEHTSNPATLTEQPLLWHYTNGVWSPVQLSIHGQLTSISMDSPTDGWAVGVNRYDQTQDQMLLLHYDGQTWQQISSNTILGKMFQPQQIQMLSPTDGWLVGTPFPYYSDPPQNMQGSGIWHFDGQTWQEQPMPDGLSEANQPGDLQVSSISMISAAEGWATVTWNHEVISLSPTPTVTPADLSPEGIILHYAAGRWTVQQTISHARLFSASVLSASEGWIGGQKATDTLTADPNAPSGVINETNAPLLLHYTQGRWVDATSSVSINAGSVFSFNSIAMLSASDGWMGFLPKNSQNFAPTLLHYNGARWVATRLPTINNTSSYQFSRVFMTSPTDGWVVGSRNVKSSPDHTYLSVPLIFHFHQGTWSVVQS